MNIFYCKDVNTENVVLDETESQHAIKVLRLKEKDAVLVFDGKGSKYKAEISASHAKKCGVRILEKENFIQHPFHLHIAIAPTKMNDRMEWFLEKATEIGINEITPIICDRSERRNTNHERFEKVLIAAMKQSMNPWLPILNEQVDFKKFIAASEPGFIAHCMNGEKKPLKLLLPAKEKITILIGPEGDFSETEVEKALSHNWQPITLGETRLRTETAALVACMTVNLMHQ